VEEDIGHPSADLRADGHLVSGDNSADTDEPDRTVHEPRLRDRHKRRRRRACCGDLREGLRPDDSVEVDGTAGHQAHAQQHGADSLHRPSSEGKPVAVHLCYTFTYPHTYASMWVGAQQKTAAT